MSFHAAGRNLDTPEIYNQSQLLVNLSAAGHLDKPSWKRWRAKPCSSFRVERSTPSCRTSSRSKRVMPKTSPTKSSRYHGGQNAPGCSRMPAMGPALAFVQENAAHTELLGHLPRFARDGNLEDVLCKTHSDRRIFHSDSSFFDAFFRLTLAHRCRLCQRRSPSHHLMAEAPTIKYRCIFWKQPIHHGGRVQITKSLTFQVFPRGGSAGAGSSLPFERIGGAAFERLPHHRLSDGLLRATTMLP